MQIAAGFGLASAILGIIIIREPKRTKKEVEKEEDKEVDENNIVKRSTIKPVKKTCGQRLSVIC